MTWHGITFTTEKEGMRTLWANVIPIHISAIPGTTTHFLDLHKGPLPPSQLQSLQRRSMQTTLPSLSDCYHTRPAISLDTGPSYTRVRVGVGFLVALGHLNLPTYLPNLPTYTLDQYYTR